MRIVVIYSQSREANTSIAIIESDERYRFTSFAFFPLLIILVRRFCSQSSCKTSIRTLLRYHRRDVVYMRIQNLQVSTVRKMHLQSQLRAIWLHATTLTVVSWLELSVEKNWLKKWNN